MEQELDAVFEGHLQVKIVALAPFPFVGGQFGGAERIYNLLTRIENSVDVICPNYGDTFTDTHKNLTMHYVSVPKELRVGEFDMVISKYSGSLLKDKLQALVPDVVVLEHPWQVDAIDGEKFVYDAHNNETELKRVISGEDSVKEASRVETKALQADHVTYCSLDDVLVTDSPKTYIPNGTDVPELNKNLGATSKTLLFVGSAHPPNIGAAITLAQLASALPDYQIVIAGNCSVHVKSDATNVSLLQHVSPAILDYLMRTAHAFINPIAAGSGTSLKVIRALSYGLPVLSSEVGARGFKDACLIVRTAQELLDGLSDLQSPKYYKEVSERSREASRAYSWDAVGKTFNEVVHSV